MSTSSAWNPKVGLLMALSVVLVIIVGVQGAGGGGVAIHVVSWPDGFSFSIPSIRSPLPMPTQVGSPNVAIDSETVPWNVALPSSDDPWDKMALFDSRMNQVLAMLGGSINSSSGFTVPSMDLRDDKGHYVVRLDMPGADKAMIKVNVEGRLLSVSGQREAFDQSKNIGEKAILSERSKAQFERTITLPAPVKADAVTADYTNGVLTIDLPKTGKPTEPTSVAIH